jgi:dolichol-phosphate mannosyltransferase
MTTLPKKTVSLVVPCYNEAPMVDAFIAHMEPIIALLAQYAFEYVFVDDGSRDDTEQRIAALAAGDPRIKGVSLSRNVGHQRAITAGLDFCGGEYIIILDADLQDPPELVPPILEQLEAGYDVVHTVRADRRADACVKRVTAKLFYLFMRRWVLPELTENAGDCKGFNRRVLLALRQYRERVRFLRGLFATLGFRQTTVSFARPKRFAGVSKYNMRNMLRLARDAVVSNSALPLRAGLYVGLLTWLLLPVYGVALLVLAFAGRAPQPLALWAVAGLLFFFMGFLLVLLGIVGEYLKVLMLEVKARPLYLVRAVYNLPFSPHK